MTPEACIAIKSRLPKGYRIRIRKETELSIGYIDKVLLGKRSNQDVINSALTILEELEEAKQLAYDRLNKIVGKSK
ncbi:MAG: hypothetical protein WC865_13700 [Bacteroidales bacterium]